MDMDLPPYAGTPFPLTPPFQFTNVTTAVFPLRANLDTLQRFVDGYINIVPPEVGYFRVALPFVHLMLLDYGRLAHPVGNLGAFSQREMFFTIPIEWYQKIDGRYVFKGWATISPFIYVDGQISLSVGRTVMGWAKSPIKITPHLTGWLQDPSGMTTDVAVSADVFPESYQGKRMQEWPLVVIRREPAAALNVPFDPEGPMSPWVIGTKLARSANELARAQLSMWRAAGLWPDGHTTTAENARRKVQSLLGMVRQITPWAPNTTVNSINLKQFRCASDPTLACYQGLTSGPLTYTSFLGGGMLGSQWGDISGGHVVELAHWPTFPVAAALGIEPDSRARGGESLMLRVRPIMPFWYRVNMQYGTTTTLASRSCNSDWRLPRLADDSRHDDERMPCALPRPRAHFNTSLGAASPVVTGPFNFKNATIHVCQLAADKETLGGVVNRFLNDPHADHDFTVAEAGDVWLVLVDWGTAESETNSIGDWADLTLSFCIPVVKNSEVGGLYPVFSFAGSTIHAQTLSELYGVPTIEAVFGRRRAGPAAELKSMLTVKVEGLPALYEAQMMRQQLVLELKGRSELSIGRESPEPGDKKKIPGFSVGKNASGERIPLLKDKVDHTGVKTLNMYTLKQFQDATHADRACYQALVQTAYELHNSTEVYALVKEDWGELLVYQSAMHPIRKTLGLEPILKPFPESPTLDREPAVERFEIKSWRTLNVQRLRMANGENLWELPSMPKAQSTK